MKDISLEQSILDVAEKLFLEKGFALTTTTEIARQVGCNQALVHYYFRKKELLFEKIFEQKMTLFSTMFFSITNENCSFTEKLERQIGSIYDLLRINPKLPFLIINEFTTNPNRLEIIKKSLNGVPFTIMQYFEKEIAIAVEKNEIRPITAIDLMINLVAFNACSFLIIPIISQAWDLDKEEIFEHRREEVIRTIINSIKK